LCLFRSSDLGIVIPIFLKTLLLEPSVFELQLKGLPVWPRATTPALPVTFPAPPDTFPALPVTPPALPGTPHHRCLQASSLVKLTRSCVTAIYDFQNQCYGLFTRVFDSSKILDSCTGMHQTRQPRHRQRGLVQPRGRARRAPQLRPAALPTSSLLPSRSLALALATNSFHSIFAVHPTFS
jgi:hypothetical protein